MTDTNTTQYQTLLDEKITTLKGLFAGIHTPNVTVFASPDTHFRMRAEFRIWHTGDKVNYVMFKKGEKNSPIIIDEFPNLIITRTFSKAMGGAGLRFGYMIGTKDVIAQINKIKLPYNISFMTEAMARILVKHHEVSDKYVTQIVEDRETLMEACRKLPFEKVFDTAANFFLVKHARHTELFEYLITHILSAYKWYTKVKYSYIFHPVKILHT